MLFTNSLFLVVDIDISELGSNLDLDLKNLRSSSPVSGLENNFGTSAVFRVPTFTGKPGKMRVHLENLEKSLNFAKNNKNHGKIT